MNNYYNCEPVLNNCIVWGNTATSGNQFYLSETANTRLNYSCYSNGTNDLLVGSGTNIFYTFNNNISSDPIFVNPSTLDLRIKGNSPAVNTGLNSYNATATDLRGQARIQDITIDMGAYEWTDGTDPGIIYVDVNAAGLNTGGSWIDAYTSFQLALDGAVFGDQIWVAKGTYKPNSDYGSGGGLRYYHFELENDVEIYGGFAGTESALSQRTDFGSGQTNETILSGDIGTVGVSTDNCLHVIKNMGVASSAMLDGFTIKNGYADGSGIDGIGGGILNLSSSPALQNLIVERNYANTGGGIYYESSTAFMNNVVFKNNSCAQSGAGLFCASTSGNLNNLTFSKNNAGMEGGGALNLANSSTIGINNGILWGNTSSGNGNEIAIQSGTLYLNYSCYSNNPGDVYNSGGTFNQLNCISVDPIFVDETTNDFRLIGTSLCVNAGNNSYNSASIDVRGKTRIQNTTIDMGAYEWTLGTDPQGMIYVDVKAIGSNTGISWNNAYHSLQSALDAAVSGDQIWVAKGTYKPSYDYGSGGGSRYYHFELENGVVIYGGFAGTEISIGERTEFGDGETNETILSGDIGTAGVRSDNCYHIIYNPAQTPNIDATAVLDGFTIKEAYADGVGIDGFGGGITNYVSSPTLQNLTIESNYALEGGGVRYESGTITLNNVLFKNNNSAQKGAGIYCNNASGSLNNVTFSKNDAQVDGGAIYIKNSSNISINNSILWGNSSSGNGNEIYINSSTLNLNNSCYANSSGDVYNTGGTFSPSANCITDDPVFVDETTNDFRVIGNSPCVNSGNNTYNSLLMDVRGQARIQNTTIDMGAYEFTPGTDPMGLVYVNCNAFGLNTGHNWTNAFSSLQSALDVAISGDTIWVAKGTYKPSSSYDLTNTSRYYHFRLREGVEVYGGFAGTETDISQRTSYNQGEANETILSGDLNGDDNFDVTNGGYQGTSGDDNCYHVWYHPNGLNLTSATVLDGFTIKSGNANEASPHNKAGGLYVYSSSPTVQNVVFTSNQANDLGGAVYIYNSTSVFENISFANNISGIGGAMYAKDASPVVNYVTFTGNKSNTDGGALATISSSLIITNAVFSSNTATNNGGAIIFYSSTVQYNATLNNVTISENQAGWSGGAIRFASNNAASVLNINNCIVWGNTATISGNELSLVSTGTTTLNYSCYKNLTNDIEVLNGILAETNNNITSNPLFANPNIYNYRLTQCSPAVDAGNNAYNSLSTDIRGETRIQNTNIDMGAYEWTYSIDPYINTGILYVDVNAMGVNNGTSWANAFSSIQSALDITYSDDQIWVAKGTYKPSSAYDLTNTSRYYHFRMKDEVEIYGGFAGTETSINERTNFGVGESNETILSGDLNGDDVLSGSGATLTFSNYSENCYHVIYNPDTLTSLSILDGFTVKGGNGDGSYPHDRGPGIFNSSASPSITNVTFTANGGVFGGGIYNLTASPIITNCLIYSNMASNGAGIENSTSSSPTFINTTIAMNIASGYGGGMNNYSNSNPIFNNCIIWGNNANTGNQIYASSGGIITLNYSCYSNQDNDVVMSSTTFIALNPTCIL